MGVGQVQERVALLVEEISSYGESSCSKTTKGHSRHPRHLLFSREVHELYHTIRNFNDGTTVLANVAIVLLAPGKVIFADVDHKNLKQLLHP